jgi:hypothetical protein
VIRCVSHEEESMEERNLPFPDNLSMAVDGFHDSPRGLGEGKSACSSPSRAHTPRLSVWVVPLSAARSAGPSPRCMVRTQS